MDTPSAKATQKPRSTTPHSPGDTPHGDHTGALGILSMELHVSYATGPNAPKGAPAPHCFTLQTHVPF